LLFCALYSSFFFQAEDGIRDRNVTGVQTCALPISLLLFLVVIYQRFASFLERRGFVLQSPVISLKSPESTGYVYSQASLGQKLRSEERRVGKECGSRWWPAH